MGRGRAKAKQTKVARQLKYNGGGFDATRLADELGGSSTSQSQSQPVNTNTNGHVREGEELDDDPYAKYAALYNDDEDDDGSDDEAGDNRRRA